MRTISVALVLTFAFGCGAARSRGQFLDATLPTFSSVPVGAFCKTSSSGAVRAFPLRLHLLSTNRVRYRRMEHVVLDVLVTNVSEVPVPLPWSAVPTGDEDRSDVDDRQAQFELMAANPGRADFVIDTFFLYGSVTMSSSLLRLASSESVTLRLPFLLLENIPREAIDSRWHFPSELPVRVGMLMCSSDDPLFRSFHEEVSDNTIPIRVMETVPAVPPPTPYSAPPAIAGVSPSMSSVGTMIRLEGYRLGDDREPNPIVHFLRGKLDLETKSEGASYRANNRDRGRQTLTVSVPAAVSPGEWQVVVDVNGSRSDPFNISIADWTGPRIDGVYPARVNPGGFISVWGAHFRSSDVGELADAHGKIRAPAADAFGVDSVSFTIPDDMADGEATVRIRSKTPDGEVVSPWLSFVVTSEPLPLDVVPNETASVAPGQWTDLMVADDDPLSRSERTEIEFVQAGQTVIVETDHPASMHVRIPSSLAAGPIVLRTRTWQSGRASQWSPAYVYLAAPRRVPPAIDSMSVGPSEQIVDLADGPEKPTEFKAAAGDDLKLHGTFPVPTGALRVTLTRGGRTRRLVSQSVNDFEIRVYLPRDIPPGTWYLSISAEGMPMLRIPIVMNVYQVT